jgi:type II secretory pathway pseudopilin PulG
MVVVGVIAAYVAVVLGAVMAAAVTFEASDAAAAAVRRYASSRGDNICEERKC